MNITETLGSKHNRSEFDCGVDVLNHFLKTQAAQAGKRNLSRTFVSINPKHPEIILGFYTLLPAEIEAPSVSNLKTPHPIPVMRLARLGVDKRSQGQGLGSELLIDVIIKVAEAYQHIPFAGLCVDAKDDTAIAFYKKFGFIEANNITNETLLWLSIKTILEVYNSYILDKE